MWSTRALFPGIVLGDLGGERLRSTLDLLGVYAETRQFSEQLTAFFQPTIELTQAIMEVTAVERPVWCNTRFPSRERSVTQAAQS